MGANMGAKMGAKTGTKMGAKIRVKTVAKIGISGKGEVQHLSDVLAGSMLGG